MKIDNEVKEEINNNINNGKWKKEINSNIK